MNKLLLVFAFALSTLCYWGDALAQPADAPGESIYDELEEDAPLTEEPSGPPPPPILPDLEPHPGPSRAPEALGTSSPAEPPSASDRMPPPRTKGKLRYDLEGIEIRGNHRTADRVVLHYVKFNPGDLLDVDDPELKLTRYRLLSTGFFSNVQLSLRRGEVRGSAVLVIEVEERNTLIVQNLWMGVAADEDTEGNAEPISAFLGVRVAETNLAGTGITLGAGVGLAADQFALRTEFADPSFLGTDWAARLHLQYLDARDFFGNREVAFESPLLEQREVTDYAVVAYQRFGGALGAGHDLSVTTQFSLAYQLERIDATVPTAASHLRGDTRQPIDFHILDGKSALSALHANLTYDTRDAPFLPTDGTLGSAGVAIGVPPLGSDYAYARLEASVQKWWQLSWGHVVKVEIFAGGIAGDAPFFEKYYVGDFTDLLPDRLLGLNPDRRQPPNFFDTSIIEVRYGDFAAKVEGEYRIPIYHGRGSIYGIDIFAATGIYGVATLDEFRHPASGYDGFSRAPIDLTYNLGLRIDTSIGGATLAFSNALGLLPARSGAR